MRKVKVQQAPRQLDILPDSLLAFSGELHFRFTKEELLQVTSPLVDVFWTHPNLVHNDIVRHTGDRWFRACRRSRH